MPVLSCFYAVKPQATSQGSFYHLQKVTSKISENLEKSLYKKTKAKNQYCMVMTVMSCNGYHRIN